MPTYKLTREAERDLDRIYVRGYYDFGEQKADSYQLGLISLIHEIAGSPMRFPIAENAPTGFRKATFKADTIYFQVHGEQCLIIRILGRQDLASSLA